MFCANPSFFCVKCKLYLERRVAATLSWTIVAGQIPTNRVQLVDVQQAARQQLSYQKDGLAPQEEWFRWGPRVSLKFVRCKVHCDHRICARKKQKKSIKINKSTI